MPLSHRELIASATSPCSSGDICLRMRLRSWPLYVARLREVLLDAHAHLGRQPG